MYIKIIGMSLIIGASTLIGMYFSRRLQYRVDAMRQLRKQLLMLKGEIRYSQTPLPEALCSIGQRNRNAFSRFFCMVGEELERFEGNEFKVIWDQGIDQYLGDCFLNPLDLERLKQLGDNLGYLDKEMQLSTLDMYLELMENDTQDAVALMHQNGKLFRYLGALGGLLIAIIML